MPCYLHSAAAVLFAVCAPALAQQSAGSRLLPVTAPLRRAGVYHVATGTWTRNASLANVTGPDTIYNNTCYVVYYAPQIVGEKWQHRSRVPSRSGPTTPSVFWGTARNDEAPGCHDSYTVDGFEFAYCSSAVSGVGYLEEFANSYTQCGHSDMVPDYSFPVTGLPGGTPSGGQKCWIVDIDLSSTTPPFVLSADGDGTYVGPSTLEQFGWSFGRIGPFTPGDSTGPLVAGNFTYVPHMGTGTPCSGTDGTIWDNPIVLAEEGTGMASNDFFRATATSPIAYNGPGCYDFGGNPHADFWLKLFADAQCPPVTPLTDYCFPGEGGIHACTTCSPANPPAAHGRGCDNFGQVTGGAQLVATGASRVSQDTIVLTSQFENNTALTVLMQGTATTNLVYGAGVRCVGGLLKRLYAGQAGSAANQDGPGVFHRPGPVDQRSVHQASLDVGYDIGAHAPISLYYQAYYRDPNAAPTCAGATFNVTQAGALNWIP
jgi:hypothetical protein